MILFRRSATSVFFLSLLLLLALPSSVWARRSHTTKTWKFSANATTVLRGRASWYGREFQGRRTTSGERFNRFQYTCAHRTLPFGTRLRVTNPHSGKSVVVRVSDRGPYRHQRILDLAEVAARPLDIVRLGAATVVAEVVDDETPLGPTDAPENIDVLRAADPQPEAAFATYTVPTEQSAALTDSLAAAAAQPVVPIVIGTLLKPATTSFIVQAGTFANLTNAQAMQAKIESLDEKLEVNLSEETIDARIMNRVLIGQFGTRAEAEAVRRRLMLWGIGGLVREIASL
ncbi:septal ring lytic transglycosylase RlpA family protein [Hymenobacter sp. ASUV-10]|uniref:Probable endolytic peptidoglycan transglycosylase RlpA n=1 Tax=Hymenobacter aranciens TaxID=3063996 RepID=A0ABT9B4V2_9BACT|nr:septal ring lytic transglycosylase RlpA family protein [Hymenobacter sp. ASUV-10]MDO7873274.1 septal ring lytic transglycosylase RlpA family protein [Hymenobacter sp. ASUV-10]